MDATLYIEKLKQELTNNFCIFVNVDRTEVISRLKSEAVTPSTFLFNCIILTVKK